MLKRHFLKPIIAFGLFFFFACSCDEIEQKPLGSSGTSFSLQIVDSLQIDYLGGLYLLDQNNRGEFLLQDAQRDKYIIANPEGDFIYSFILNEGDKDYPGFSFESPAFFRDDQIVFYTLKGLLFYDFNGNLLSKSEPIENNLFIGRLDGKAIFEVEIEGNNYLVTINLSFLRQDPNKQSFYDDFRAINLFNLTTQEIQKVIPLDPSSSYLDGRYHEKMRLINSFAILGDKIAIAYPFDPQIYLYRLHKDSVELLQILPLREELKYIDRQKERKMETTNGRVVEDTSMPIQKAGESQLGKVSLLEDDLVLVIYNPGLPEELREEIKIVVDGDYVNRIFPDNIPKSRYAVFFKGQKAGGDEKPSRLGSIAFTKDDFIWFTERENEDLEEDFVKWYKVKLIPN